GALNDVRTVTLLSNGPLATIKKVYLDNHSKTSANLIKVLAKFYWKMDIEWVTADIEMIKIPLPQGEGMLAIGDKVFDLEQSFEYQIDLAKEWHQFTGLPMVFAVWVTSKELSPVLTEQFCKALAFGVENISLAAKSLNGLKISHDEATHYLTKNISYVLDKPKRDAIALFEHYVNLMNPKE
ncbi:MAG: ABC transporter substrate-binding protein, partial [Bacteroidales bacterium]|nr:ABC transporter substrate-binding protein [Bacteroidales bacterium]